MVAAALAVLSLVIAITASPIPFPPAASSNSPPHTYPVTVAPAERGLEWAQAEEQRARKRHEHLLPVKERPKREDRVQRGTAPLKSWGDSYSIRASIGTPPQPLDLYLDTGSTDLWVIGTCDAEKECGTTPTFNVSASSSYTHTDQLFAMRYLDGGASIGVWGGDVVEIGGQAVRTYFGITSHTTNWATAQSGLLGLAAREGSSKGVEPWWETASKEWADGQFGLSLGRNSLDEAGSVTFGGVDRTKFAGELTYYPTTALEGWEAGWNIATRGIALDGKRLTEASKVKMAVLDCGSTGIVGPKPDVDAFYAALGVPIVDLKDGSYAFECSNPLGKAVSFVFGDYDLGARDYRLSPDEPMSGEQAYALREADLAIVRGSAAEFAETGGYEAMRGREGIWCFGAVSSWGSTDQGSEVDAWILGDSFLKNVYSAYRREPRSVGLARVPSSGAGGTGWDGVPPAGAGLPSS